MSRAHHCLDCGATVPGGACRVCGPTDEPCPACGSQPDPTDPTGPLCCCVGCLTEAETGQPEVFGSAVVTVAFAYTAERGDLGSLN